MRFVAVPVHLRLEVELGAEFFEGETGFAEGADAEGVVALGEAGALVVAHEVGVEVGGGGECERALEEDLAGGGFQEVAAADDFGDAHVGVVYGAG